MPAALEPDVRFWIRVYSEISTDEGFIHDEHNLGIVYEKLRFDPELTPRERQQKVDAERERLHDVLRRLASGLAPADEAERKVRALWGEADAARLLQAADEVRFQLGQADRFRAGLERAGHWQKHIAEELARLGLPPEIAALPHVESSFNPEAWSKVGAAGLWQFMRSTGRLYLRIDNSVDERLDPFRATEAAAQLLSYNYRVLGNWPLAITAYNHGAAGMRRAIEQVGSDDIVRILREYKSKTFGFASRNFYVSFLAALTISRAPEKYFANLQRASTARYQEIALTLPANIAAVQKATGLPDGQLRELNPALRPVVWSGQRMAPKGYRLRLPASIDLSGSQLMAQLAGTSKPIVVAALRPPASARPATPATAAAPAAATTAAVTGSASATGAASAGDYYVVRHGDTLGSVATATSVRMPQLMRLNGLRDSDYIYEGQRLRLREEVAVPREAASEPNADERAALAESRQEASARATAAARAPAMPVTRDQAVEQGPTLVPGAGAAAEADAVDYAVAANDTIVIGAAETLGHYADWLHISAARLRVLNGYSSRTPVSIGRRLKLDFARVSRADFEQKRREYHQHLRAEYFASNILSGASTYTIRRGDTLWSLTQREQVPVWLLQQFNPEVDFADLRPGVALVIPKVSARG